MNQPQRKPVSFKIFPTDSNQGPSGRVVNGMEDYLEKRQYTDAGVDMLVGQWDKEVGHVRRSLGFVREEQAHNRTQFAAMQRSHNKQRRLFFTTLRQKAAVWVKWETFKAVCFLLTVLAGFIAVGSLDAEVGRMTDHYQSIVSLGNNERAMQKELPAIYGY